MASYVPAGGTKLIEFLDRIDAEVKETTRDRRLQIKRNIRLFHTGSPDKQDAPPLFSANLIGPNVRRGAALLTEQKPLLDIRPRREGLAQTARLLRDTIRAVWDEQGIGMQLEDCVLRSKVMQSAFFMIAWDPEANYGLGDIACYALDFRQVGVDPSVQKAQDCDYAQYIYVDSVVPLSTAQRNFPHIADRLMPSDITSVTDEDITSLNYSNRLQGPVERAWRRFGGGSRKGRAIPRIRLRTYWLVDPEVNSDESPVYPNGRVIVRTADQDLICNRERDDSGNWAPGQSNPYYDGRWPIEWLDNAPDLDSPWGRDELEAVRRIQHSFNKLGNVGVKTTLQNAIGISVADQNTLQPEALNYLRDMGYYVVEKAAGRSFERGAPQVALPSLVQFMGYMQGLMDNVEGLTDAGGNIGTSKGRAEVRSAVMLEGLQQMSQILVRASARRFEAFLERVGQKLISRIFQFYTQDRLLTYVANNGEMRKVEFERRKLMEELVKLAADRLQQEAQNRRKEESSEESERAQYGGAQALTRPGMETPILGEDDILATIKGAWRDFRFMVEPFSSLSQNRIARAQQRMQLAQQGMIPSWMVLQELGFEDPRQLQEEALEEAKRRQELGLQPAQQQQGQKKGSSKKQ